MGFFSDLLEKCRTLLKIGPQDKGADRAVTPHGPDNALTQLRRQARTGDPTLKGKHQSGSF